jgi:hypothetical protein
MNAKILLTLTVLTCLAGCGLVSTQALYEEIRAQEKAKAVGTSAPAPTRLPPYDTYQKERSDLRSEPR